MNLLIYFFFFCVQYMDKYRKESKYKDKYDVMWVSLRKSASRQV